MTLYELHAPIMIYAEHRHDYGEIDEQALKNKVEEAAQILEEAISILKLEDPDTPEGTIGRIAEQSFDQLKASIRKEKEKDPTTIDV
uniref:Uncharacterized protein n=1 Tax=Timema bartmani TaxID=61472 RepID=A0A7R9F7K6_9NEOP|nr:unnamed protein product [Timema bartmani]